MTITGPIPENMKITRNESKDYPTVFFAPFDGTPSWTVRANLWNKSVSWPSASLQSVEDAVKFRDALTAAIHEAEK